MLNVPRWTYELAGFELLCVFRVKSLEGVLEVVERRSCPRVGWYKGSMEFSNRIESWRTEKERSELYECSERFGAFVAYVFESFAFGSDFLSNCGQVG